MNSRLNCLARACAGALGLAVILAASGRLVAAEPMAFSRERATQSVKAHTTFLADDLLEGRGTGTRGHALAGRYVAAQFQRLGLKPAGEGGSYEQALELNESADAIDASKLVIHGKPVAPEFVAVNDVIVRAAPGRETGSVRAPAVFVGSACAHPS